MGVLLTTTAEATTTDALLSVAQALLVLIALIAFAWLFVQHRLGARGAKAASGLRVESRTALDLKSSLWIIEVEGKRLLIGTADGSSPRLLRELDDKRTSKELSP